ncbi:MAG: hypothetical protein ACC651_08755 [Candidatus Scalindua sp.]
MVKDRIDKRGFDKDKTDNIKWFLRFTLLERIEIARKNMLRARRFRGLALKKDKPGG